MIEQLCRSVIIPQYSRSTLHLTPSSQYTPWRVIMIVALKLLCYHNSEGPSDKKDGLQCWDPIIDGDLRITTWQCEKRKPPPFFSFYVSCMPWILMTAIVCIPLRSPYAIKCIHVLCVSFLKEGRMTNKEDTSQWHCFSEERCMVSQKCNIWSCSWLIPYIKASITAVAMCLKLAHSWVS